MPNKELKKSLIMAKSTSSSSSSKSSTTTDSALSGIAKILKLLPTGTVFVFMFLSPILSNNGKCYLANKVLTAILLGVCGLSCALASFTDSYTDKHGKTHYGFVTTKGLHTFDGSEDKKEEELAKYNIGISDFVHAVLSLLVFGVLAILNSDTVECFFPSLASSENTLTSVLPAVVGVISSFVSMLFPSTRHGLGSSSSSVESSGV